MRFIKTSYDCILYGQGVCRHNDIFILCSYVHKGQKKVCVWLYRVKLVD
jgi:hypothetical protein